MANRKIEATRPNMLSGQSRISVCCGNDQGEPFHTYSGVARGVVGLNGGVRCLGPVPYAGTISVE
jgi:hypothetical protein